MKFLYKRGSVTTVLLISLASRVIAAQTRRWVLPVADGGGVDPSPPSVHGYLTKVSENRFVLKNDKRVRDTDRSTEVRINSRTDFFTAYGGPYKADELRAGQYVWVWYISPDPSKAGTPPRAAVVVLWSKDPDDKPDDKTRWSYDRRR